MKRSKKHLAFISIIVLVLLSLLGGVVTATANQGKQAEESQGDAEVKADLGTAAPLALGGAEVAAEEGGDGVAAPAGDAAPEASIECWPVCYKGKICGTKFLDSNQNGKKDVGEAGIPGVTIELWKGGSKIASTTTAADGSYCFDELAAGTYTVKEIVPAGYNATTPTSYTVELCEGETETRNFGNVPVPPPPGSICGKKFLDSDEDGQKGAGEPGMAGVVIELRKDGQKIAETTTAADGSYSFSNLQPGIYTVREIVPDGYHATTPDSYVVEVVSGQAATRDFGNAPNPVPPGSICGKKFLDSDEDGQKGAGEPGMAGVVIELRKDGQKIAQTTTAADGSYCFNQLEPGDYTVKEVVPEGYHATTPVSYDVEVCPGQTVTRDFGNALNPKPLGSISGHKWRDYDWDGAYDPGEPGVGGVTIELWKDGSKVAQTVTAADGSYSFSDLEPGLYTVKEVVPPFMAATSPVSVEVSLGEDEDVTGVDFLNRCALGVVEVLVYEDTNCNGEIDGGDALFPTPVKIQLYHVLGGGLVPADGWDGPFEKMTGAGVYPPPWWPLPLPPYPAGCAGWKNLPADDGSGGADYVVKMVVPDGWSAPLGSEYGPFTLKCIITCSWQQVKFLLAPKSHLAGFKYEDTNSSGAIDAGDKPVEGVTIELWKDGAKIDETVTAADGSYIFEDLEEGIYTVKEILPAGWFPVVPDDGIWEDFPVGCGDVDGKNFLNDRLMEISGHKYEDADASGAIDAGDGPVEGVTIELWKDGAKVAETTTAADGSYSFTNLKPGTYTVKEVLPPEWFPVVPDDGVIEDLVLAGGESVDDADFLNCRYVEISGHKYEDADASGAIDAGDGPVEGVTIELWKDGAKVAETTTAADGSYSFTNLKPGTYTVKEVLPPEWFPVVPDDGVIEDLVLLSGDKIDDADFLNCRYGDIEGWKYWDKDESGLPDEGEGLDGVTIVLTPEAGAPQVTVTAGGGYFYFGPLKPGKYTVSVDESTAPGYFPISATSVEVEVACGETTKVYFTEAPYGSISGHKWLDANFDGVWGAEETTVIAGITIKLYEGEPVGDPVAVTVTAEDGSYSFTNLKPGLYTVVEEAGAAYFSATPSSVGIELSAGEGAVVDFGNCPYGRIVGTKINDYDSDGARDPNEPGLEGVKITLVGLGGLNAYAETYTGEDGSFVFNNLLPGEYEVSETVPSGFYSTRPIKVVVTVGPAESIEVVFANAEYASIIANKWIEANGNGKVDPDVDKPKEGITIRVTGETLRGETVDITLETEEDGSAAFLLLEAGDYKVEESFDTSQMSNISPTSVDVPELMPGDKVVVDFLNAETRVEPQPPIRPDVLPQTGMDQLPAYIAAGSLILLGLLLLALGYRRRYQH